MHLSYEFETVVDDMDKIVPFKDAMAAWGSSHYDHEKAGDYSATKLVDTPRRVQLIKRHHDDLELPLASQVNAFFGTAVHDHYEKLLSRGEKYTLEQRMSWEHDGRVITGKFDILVDDSHVYDIKTTKAWKLVFDPKLEEWHEQQNIYAWLLRRNSYTVDSLNLLVHYYDWTEGLSVRDPMYPRQSVIQYILSLWPESMCEEYIDWRLQMHRDCEDTPDSSLPECSPKDRWERFADGSTCHYAVVKNPSSKRATRVFKDSAGETLEDALEYGRSAKGHGNESFVEVRYAQRKRCELYCSCAKHCNHYQEYKTRNESGTLNDIIPLYN